LRARRVSVIFNATSPYASKYPNDPAPKEPVATARQRSRCSQTIRKIPCHHFVIGLISSCQRTTTRNLCDCTIGTAKMRLVWLFLINV
jgi:hypothetical protein